jgi:hypothetical protein
LKKIEKEKLFCQDNPIKGYELKNSRDPASIFETVVGSVYNPGRLNFGEVEVFLSRLSVLSLEYVHLMVLGDFNLDILINR